MKRIVIIIGLLTLSAMLLFTTGGAEAEVNLSVSVMGNFLGDEMPVLLEEFGKQNPDLKADVVRVAADDWADYFTKVRTLIAGGDSPDVMYVAIEGGKYVALTGMAIPVDEYIAASPEVQAVVEDLHPKLQAAFEFEGKTWGTVFGWNNVVTHFNLDMLKEVGLDVPSGDWDLDEFLRYAQALTREVDGQKVFGIALPGHYFTVNAWLYNFGASMLNEDWNASALDTPQALKAFQALHDLVYKYEVAPSYDGGDQSINQFINDQAAMCFLGRWPLPSWEENDMNFNIQFMPNMGAQQVIFGSGAFMISSGSEHPEEAFKLASFLSSAWSQKTAIGINTIPTSISVMDEILPESKPANSMLYRQSADIAKAVQSPKEFPEIAQIFLRYYSLMMANEMDVEEAVNAMHDEINAVFAD